MGRRTVKALSAGVALTLALGVVVAVVVVRRRDAGPHCTVAPAYHVTSTRFGVSLGRGGVRTFAEAATSARATFGDRAVLRIFDPGVPDSDAWKTRLPSLSPGEPVVTSFRMSPRDVLDGTYDARLRHFFSTAPRDRPVFWSYYHEPETAVRAGQFTAAQFRAAFRHVADLAADACRSNLYPTLILTGYTADASSGRSWQDYYPGSKYVSLVAWDPYNSANATPTSYADPATLFGGCVRDSKEAGKPWAIAETGSGLVPGDSGVGRAAWLTAVGRYAKAEHAAFVVYFNATDKVDFRLDDPASIGAWRALVGS